MRELEENGETAVRKQRKLAPKVRPPFSIFGTSRDLSWGKARSALTDMNALRATWLGVKCHVELGHTEEKVCESDQTMEVSLLESGEKRCGASWFQQELWSRALGFGVSLHFPRSLAALTGERVRGMERRRARKEFQVHWCILISHPSIHTGRQGEGQFGGLFSLSSFHMIFSWIDEVRDQGKLRDTCNNH